MNISKLKVLIILILLIAFAVSAFSRMQGDPIITDKKMDSDAITEIGDISLRLTNYGNFGSGSDSGWPSLEYPTGSSIDYLYIGGLWFGAKKIRRDELGRKYFWLSYPPEADDAMITENDTLWTPDLQVVVDTLVSIGCDGWHPVKELLPAYNPREQQYLGALYTAHNFQDKTVMASILDHRKGVDDDNDGLIDEDPIGYAFPFRASDELPVVFSDYGGDWLHNSENIFGTEAITNEDNQSIWFPLGFVDLSDETNEIYNFTEPIDDDGDGISDEDGYPVSEADFISYYYDYSPFVNGDPDPDRDDGGNASENEHVPLNIRIRQMTYQWSYDYIRNLVYIEFNITNMNVQDTLYDCAMGIYMDSDVGPQSFGGAAIAPDDISSYVSGIGYEFAYTYDYDTDDGLTKALVGSRVCTPDPELLEFACWTWTVSYGPQDVKPLEYTNHVGNANTSNEKYWLLTGRNPENPENAERPINLRDYPNYQIDEFGPEGGTDTRYLFAFYGAQPGTPEFNDPANRWNLAPGRTMKIVIAIFPGYDLFELKRTAEFAKFIYGEAQTLTTVVEPDTFLHYQAPEPPAYPNMYAGLINDGNAIHVYWDNRSEFTIDNDMPSRSNVGWQIENDNLDSYAVNADTTGMPERYWPSVYGIEYDNPENIFINPWTANRLRHDFQGYALYGRSGTSQSEYWEEKGKWDKNETEEDLIIYLVNEGDSAFVDYQGELGIGNEIESLPNKRLITVEDENYYHLDEFYESVPFIAADEYVFGDAIYDYTKTKATADADPDLASLSYNEKALYFANPYLLAKPNGEDIYLELYSRSLIPLEGFISTNILPIPEKIEEIRIDRLSRRYYDQVLYYPPKGIEYYAAVTTFDRGYPPKGIASLESGAEINMMILYPGPSAKSDMENIYVVPNPYIGQSNFDGRREDDFTGDRSRRIWFVNLPENCTIKIYTLAGDLVDKVVHHGGEGEDIITPGAVTNRDKLKQSDITATGMASWDLLSRNNQITAPGVYLFSVKDLDSGDIKVGKFVIIK